MKEYTLGDIKSRVNSRIENKIAMLTNSTETVADSASELIRMQDFRSHLRSSFIVPIEVTDGVYTYYAPQDLKDSAVIGVTAKDTDVLKKNLDFSLTLPEQFDVKVAEATGYCVENWMTVDHKNGVPIIKTNFQIETSNQVVADISSITGWVATDDAFNIQDDSIRYIVGGGSLQFDTSVGGTEASVENTSVASALDLSSFIGADTGIYMFVDIPDATNLTGFRIRFGVDATNYFEATVTQTADGFDFTKGFNRLNFKLDTLATVGAPDPTSINYLQFTVQKTAAKIAATGWRINGAVVGVSENYTLSYYTRYIWKDDNDRYKELPETDTDVLHCDTTEYMVYVDRAAAQAAFDTDLSLGKIDRLENKSITSLKEFGRKNPSQAKNIIY